MNNLLTNLNNALKTKEDMQRLVLTAVVLFILFVKCYMVVSGYNFNKAAGKHSTNHSTIALIKNNI